MKKTLLLSLASAFLLVSCEWREPCDPTSEPYAKVSMDSYNVSADSIYQKAYLLSSQRPTQAHVLSPNDSLPMSLASDTTLYVFESPSHRDTVGFTYRRNVAFQESECGFTVTLDQFRVLSLTTAKRVSMNVAEREAGGFNRHAHPTEYTLYIKP